MGVWSDKRKIYRAQKTLLKQSSQTGWCLGNWVIVVIIVSLVIMGNSGYKSHDS